jgi:hypothetical protein
MLAGHIEGAISGGTAALIMRKMNQVYNYSREKHKPGKLRTISGERRRFK